ncbi:MAG: glycoside hydrolase family 15 protein [Candidatus Bipolaricaulia bacterium]
MPRDLPLSNGSLLINFDRAYQVCDLTWPHVGWGNHLLGHPCRVGVWVEGAFRWLDDPAWQRELRYVSDTLVTDVTLTHPDLALELHFRDAVDFHENLFIRRIEVSDRSGRTREVRLFFHHDLHISGYEVGDTAYYEPERRALFHYKGPHWFLFNGIRPDDDGTLHVGLDQWTTGHKEIHGLEGTWRDAEDGHLEGHPITQGAVDSCGALHVCVPARGHVTCYVWLAVGSDFSEVTSINRLVRNRGPERFLDRTTAYWRLWLHTRAPDLGTLPSSLNDLYCRSLLVIRTQVDHAGGILAATDSEIASTVRDTYAYVWPRDGALVAYALDEAGYQDVPRGFYTFCANVTTREGYLLHKFNPDGSLASSWHPWLLDGEKRIPVQEDETGLVLDALWHHFCCHGDVEFIKPLYRPFIIRAAEWLAGYRDPDTGLPQPSWDLWEERWGIHAWTVAATWAGLNAAAHFAEAFDEAELVQRYREAADGIRQAVEQHLWHEGEGRFLRSLVSNSNGTWNPDLTVDASLAGLWLHRMFTADDPRIVKTMEAVHERLWVKTPIGGLARYEGDYYHRAADDVPGNPWFVCTMWLAMWYIALKRVAEALDLFNWCTERALPSGVLAEQVHPHTGTPLSVSPLTWSHAVVVRAVQMYLSRLGLEGGDSA